MLKANVTFFRHPDRTPKQNLKYNSSVSEPWTQPFINLLNTAMEEIFFRKREQLTLIADAIEEAKQAVATRGLIQHAELNDYLVSTEAQKDLPKLAQLSAALEKKIDLLDTKAQLKQAYRKVEPSVARGVSQGELLSPRTKLW